MPKESRFSERMPKPVAPYCHAAIANGFAFVSGMLSQDLASGEFVFDGIAEQTRRILDNLCVLLDDLGSDLDSVVKVTIFLRDMACFPAVNTVYGEFFRESPPARSCVAVAGLPKDADIEIEVVVAL